MTSKVFTVYDSKADLWLNPFCMRSRGEALRSWAAVVNDEQSQFCKFPTDFSLFEVADFDDNNGNVIPHVAKVCLGTALEFKSKPNVNLVNADKAKEI